MNVYRLIDTDTRKVVGTATSEIGALEFSPYRPADCLADAATWQDVVDAAGAHADGVAGYVEGYTVERIECPEPHDTIEAERLYPPHEACDQAKFEALKAAMESSGWVGRPILADSVDYQAWTGSHRLAAAVALGLAVPVVWLDNAAWDNPEQIGFDQLRDDEERLSFLIQMCDVDAIAIMRAEVE